MSPANPRPLSPGQPGANGLCLALRWPIRLLVVIVALMLLVPGRSAADPFGDDPVEAFRQVLKADEAKRFPGARKDVALGYAVAYRKRKLEEAEKDLKTISDLGQGLILIEWPSRVPREAVVKKGTSLEGYIGSLSEYEQRCRRIEIDVRSRMVQRLNSKAKAVLSDPRVRPASQIAVCNLVSDLAAAAEEVDDFDLSLYALLAPLAEDLRNLARRTTNPDVRSAVATALGRFPKSPKVAAQTLGEILRDRRKTEPERRAAAAALVNLVQAVTGDEPLRSSEPGVGRREAPRGQTRRFEVGFRRDLLDVINQVVPVAASGLTDPAASVREQCATALNRAASAMVVELSLELQVYRDNSELPSADKERNWGEEERKIVEFYHKELRDTMAQFSPALEGFAQAAPAMTAAVVDRDQTVRLEARRTLENLARIRRILVELGTVIPPLRPAKDKAKPEKKAFAPASAPARAGNIVLVRTSGTVPADGEPSLPVLHLPPPQAEKGKTEEGAVKKNEQLIDSLLGKVGKSLRVTGFTDSNPRARRAALETVEAYGELAHEYLPQVIRALEDRDVFVRWIAARTLARMASAAEPGKPPAATTAVPALIRRLDDDDLDARIAAARALTAYGVQAERAVPALTARVERGDVESRVAMMKALESIGTASAPALPALARSLNDIDPRVRTEATRVIGRFGTNKKTRPLAERYLPELRRLTTDRDADVRRTAAAAIISITSEE